jgi:8-oxo-dGTP diphosphatase
VREPAPQEQEGAAVKETHVVTCFVMDQSGRLLLLRRSGQVGSYQGRWAGVSGYLEAQPEEQAYTELSEEVGLSHDDVTLETMGEALEIEDPAMDRKWVIHPFRFILRDPRKVRLDWEHTESAWIDPSEMNTFLTVPGLADAYVRVSRGSAGPNSG